MTAEDGEPALNLRDRMARSIQRARGSQALHTMDVRAADAIMADLSLDPGLRDSLDRLVQAATK